MQIRVVRLTSRNPLVAAALVALVLVLLALVLAVGLTVGAGLAIAGGAALVARRVLGGRARGRAAAAREHALDASREVFPPTPGDAARRLPPGA